MNKTGRRVKAASRKSMEIMRRGLLIAALAIFTVAVLLVIFPSDSRMPSATMPGAAPVATTTMLSHQITMADTRTEPPEAIPAYLSEKIPLDPHLQEIMWNECERWGCPYTLALAVAEVESEFDMWAVGAIGEVGLMQLNPGPGGAYHDELEAATGMDPKTQEGNISCGVYLLGKYMTLYDDVAKSAMAYSMGHSGAKKAWAAGVTTIDHAEKVLAAMARWEAALHE